VLSGAEERLSRGNARDAVMASAAIPGVFPPVVWHDRELVDGGVANNAPISHALEMGATRIYVFPTGTACDLDEPPRGALGMLLHSMNLLVMRRLLVEIELLRERAELIVLPPPCPLRVSSMDFGHADELIRDSHESAAGHLDAIASGCAVAAAPTEALG
jgi:NTE family protein